jgi:uncharacterized protein
VETALRSDKRWAFRRRNAVDVNNLWGYINAVKITFDPAKRQAALGERGLDFADALIVFAGPTITVQDTRRDHGEPRYQTVGFLAGRMVVMVVWTPRNEARHVHLNEKVQ